MINLGKSNKVPILYVASLLHAEDILSISVEGKIAQSVCLYGTNS